MQIFAYGNCIDFHHVYSVMNCAWSRLWSVSDSLTKKKKKLNTPNGHRLAHELGRSSRTVDEIQIMLSDTRWRRWNENKHYRSVWITSVTCAPQDKWAQKKKTFYVRFSSHDIDFAGLVTTELLVISIRRAMVFFCSRSYSNHFTLSEYGAEHKCNSIEPKPVSINFLFYFFLKRKLFAARSAAMCYL